MGQELTKILETDGEREKRILEDYRKSSMAKDLFCVANSFRERLEQANKKILECEKYKELYYTRISTLSQKIDEETRDRINEKNLLNIKIKKKETETAELSKQNTIVANWNVSLRAELVEAHQKILALEKNAKIKENYLTEISKLNGACMKKNDTIKQLEKKVGILTEETDSSNDLRDKLEKANQRILKVEKFEKNKETYCNQISNLSAACTKKNETIKELEKRVLDLSREVNSKKFELGELHSSEIRNLTKKVEVLTSDLKVSGDRVLTLTYDLVSANDKAKAATDLEQETNDLRDKLEKANQIRKLELQMRLKDDSIQVAKLNQAWERRVFELSKEVKFANNRILELSKTSNAGSLDETNELRKQLEIANETIKELNIKVSELCGSKEAKDSVSSFEVANSKSQNSGVGKDSEACQRESYQSKNGSDGLPSNTQHATDGENSTRQANNVNENWDIQETQLLAEIINKSEAIKELGSRIFELTEELKMRDLDENGRKVEMSCLNLKYEKKCEELKIKEQDLWECKQKIAKLRSRIDKRKREIQTCDPY